MSKKFNRYVLPVITKSNSNILFNTITKEKYKITESEDFYESKYCYENQEMELIKKQLFAPPDTGNFLISSTWECSLRCSHCCVLDKLKKTDNNDVNLDALNDFLIRYREKYAGDFENFTVYVAFVGGEIGLKPKQALEQMKVFKDVFKNYPLWYSTATTNLYYNLTDDHYEFFNHLTDLVVSVDGLEEDHNKQRKSFGDYKSLGNPFQKTIDNLDFLITKKNMSEKIKVQASVKDEIYFDIDKKIAFYEYFIRKGLYAECISWNGLFPTRRNPKQSKAFELARKPPRLYKSPCCKFRFMSRIQIDPDNKIYTDYFQHNYLQELCHLGSLQDSLEKLEINYKNMILQEMPALNDKNCMICPVLGYCWGQCVNANAVMHVAPSSVCNQQEMINEVFGQIEKREIDDIETHSKCDQ